MISYIQYSRSRKPEFDLITGFEVVNGKTYVFKQAKSSSAQKFISSFIENYKTLENIQSVIKVVSPEIRNEKVYFEFVEGQTFALTLETAIKNSDEVRIKQILDAYINLIKELSKKESNPDKLSQTNEFFNVDFSNENLWIRNGLVDLDWGNIIIDAKNSYHLIDYEWMFDFPVPTNYVIFRALNNLHIHFLGGQNLFSEIIQDAYKEYLNPEYIKAEYEFQKHARRTMEDYEEFLSNHLNYIHEGYKVGNYISQKNDAIQQQINTIRELSQELSSLKGKKSVRAALKVSRILNKAKRIPKKLVGSLRR